MSKYIKFFWWIVRHKLRVFKFGLRCGVPIWQLIVHDLSHFHPAEFFALADGDITSDGFLVAHWHNIRFNSYRWEQWLYCPFTISAMPIPFIREMIADWMARVCENTDACLDFSEWLNSDEFSSIFDIQPDITRLRIVDALDDIGYVKYCINGVYHWGAIIEGVDTDAL